MQVLSYTDPRTNADIHISTKRALSSFHGRWTSERFQRQQHATDLNNSNGRAFLAYFADDDRQGLSLSPPAYQSYLHTRTSYTHSRLASTSFSISEFFMPRACLPECLGCSSSGAPAVIALARSPRRMYFYEWRERARVRETAVHWGAANSRTLQRCCVFFSN